jgi:hypothetical protein
MGRHTPDLPQIVKDKKICLGPRISGFLRECYLENRAKRIASDFRVSTGTAKRWLAGFAPTPAIIEEMANRWGTRCVAAAFADHLAAHNANALKLITMMRHDEVEREREKLQRLRELQKKTPEPAAEAADDLDVPKFQRARPPDSKPWSPLLKELVAQATPPARRWYQRILDRVGIKMTTP